MHDVNNIITEINDLEDIYLRCKSIFPVLDSSLIGKTSFQTAQYYQWRGYSVSINTGNPITRDFIDRYAKIGKWINENAIIRLFGILYYHKQVGMHYRIDRKLPGGEDVRYCCWIRNVVTKTRLNYEPETEDNIKLREKLIAFYNLEPNEYSEGQISTPVDKVIQPMFEGCRRYLRAKYRSA